MLTELACAAKAVYKRCANATNFEPATGSHNAYVAESTLMKLTPFEAGLMLHLIGDWVLQNEWMAVNKVKLSHPASWVHSAIHGVLLGLYFGWLGGLTLAVLHLLIDTRVALIWWNRVFKKCENPVEWPIILIGFDQVLHISCIAAWILFQQHFGSQ
jgi:hypothetical protein